MVIWIIGLSGSGKTTLAENVVAKTRARKRKVVLLDGDRVREVFGNGLGHDLVSRRENSERLCRLCQLLDEQGIDVVCAILSLFPDAREWCRNNLSGYFEVFIDAPLEQLIARDDKEIYEKYTRCELNNVAGLDLAFPSPTTADLVIANNGGLETLLNYADIVVDQICRRS